MRLFNYTLLFACLLFVFKSNAQLSLDYCIQRARENYPLIKQAGLIEAAKQYNVENAGKAYLPQVSISGQATYQSEVTKIPISMPGVNIPSLDKDQYKAAVDVSQLIWDGGSTRAAKKILKASADADFENMQANLYAVNEKVNNVFFGVLAIDAQQKQLDILTDNLNAAKSNVESLFGNGLAMQADLDVVNVELLQVEQTKVDLQWARRAYVNMLAALMGEEIDNDKTFQMPHLEPDNQQINRPELVLFQKQRELLMAKESSIKAKNMPKLSLFAQGGYGKPGLNMLSNQFGPFAMGGVRFTWNFGNIYTNKNEKSLIKNNIQNVDLAQEVFIFNNNLQLIQTNNQTQKLLSNIKKDDDIIKLRTDIRKASESKYKNGVYTASDLLKDINAESKAMQDKALRQIQHLQSIYNQKIITGN